MPSRRGWPRGKPRARAAPLRPDEGHAAEPWEVPGWRGPEAPPLAGRGSRNWRRSQSHPHRFHRCRSCGWRRRYRSRRRNRRDRRWRRGRLAIVTDVIVRRDGIVPDAVVDFGERTNRRQVLGGRAQDMFELVPRLVEPAELEQRSPERDARRDIGRVPLQAGFTGGDRVLELPCPAVLFGQGRERDRRRILLDPASQFLDAGVVHFVRDRDRAAPGREAAVYHPRITGSRSAPSPRPA